MECKICHKNLTGLQKNYGFETPTYKFPLCLHCMKNLEEMLYELILGIKAK